MRTPDAIKADVDRGLVIYALQTALKLELEGIEARLEADALDRSSEHQPLEEASREGKKWMAKGTAKELAVVFSADSLTKTFPHGSELHVALLAACGGYEAKFEKLFKEWHGFECREDDGLKFRKAAEQILGAKEAPAFITTLKALDKHGIPKSATKLMWKDSAADAKLKEVAV